MSTHSNESCHVCHDLLYDTTSRSNSIASTRVPLSEMTLRARQGCPTCSLLWSGISFYLAGLGGSKGDILSEESQKATFIELLTHEKYPLWVRAYNSATGSKLIDIEFYVPLGQQALWPAIKPAPPVHDDILSAVRSRKVNEWIQDCLDHHQLCRELSASSSYLPKRVLDVYSSGSRDPILYEPREGEIGLYTALCHCWGPFQPLQTTRATLDERKCGIAWATLPKTFQHAILFTRGLGVKYIWIDSLCIIQDDVTDWETQSSQMASIFEKSYLTISAACASDGTEGLMKPRQSTTHQIRKELNGEVFSILVRPSIKHAGFLGQHKYGIPGQPIENLPLFWRGWCFQEQLLSVRKAQCTPSELRFECASGTRCECGFMELPEARSGLHFNSFHSDLAHLMESRTRCDTNCHREKARQRKLPWQIWISLVEMYSSRHLTFSKDLLPAISGIANKMQGLGLATYLAGLWTEDLAYQLCWRSVSACASHRHSAYLAPSFSWASRMGSILGTFLPCFIVAKIHIKILEARCFPRGANPFGEVVSGFIRLRGRLVPVMEVRNYHSVSSENYENAVKMESFIRFDTCEDYDTRDMKSLYYLRILSYIDEGRKSSDAVNQVQVLVLKRSISVDHAYERVGIIAEAEDRNFDGFCGESDIVIV